MSNWQGGGPPPGSVPPQQGWGPQQQPQQGYAQPQQGYGPPQQQQQQQQSIAPYGNAAMGWPGGAFETGLAAGPRSVLGVPLAPDERVIYYDKPSYKTEKVVLWILGVLTVWLLVGIVFIVLAITTDSRNPRAQVLTNRRVIEISGKGVPTWIPLNEVVDLVAERQKTAGGGGLIGLAVSAAIMAVANSSAEKNSKMNPDYWKRTLAIRVVGRALQMKLRTRRALALGPFMAHCVFQPGSAEHAPNVNYDA